MRGLFIIGNKRSGSTHLMRLLNLHEKIYVSNESDVIWILFNYHNNRQIIDYPHDSPAGMRASLEKAGSLLSKESSVADNLVNFQRKLMHTGFLQMKPVNKSGLEYIGDQKPYQNSDPELLPFILGHFTNAKFIHLLRHPFEVTSSSLKFGGGTGGHIWKNMTPEEILEKWEMHENWALRAKEDHKVDVLDVRYESLIAGTEKTMAEVFQFLELPYDRELLWKCRSITVPNFKSITNYPLTQSQKKLLQKHSMKTSYSLFTGRVVPAIKNFWYRSILRLRRLSG